ncbi:MAG: hypothetical protein Q9166_001427 [cf. Caloplaca sp. 2 TL-2023]
MTAVSTVAVILRMLGRRVSAAKYGADDFLIVVALVLTYGLNANEIIAVHFGFGRHQLMLSLDHISKFLLNDWTIQIIFACAISVTRLSLLMFYHRIFPVKRFTIVAIITGCILVAWWIAFIFAILFSCYPIESYWNKAIVGKCVNEHTLSWGVTGSELATNIIMLVLPIPWLWDLRLPWTKKLALIGLFMLGCFVCVSCIVRFPLLAALKQTDASWTIVPAGIWIVVECNIGIASVCLPLMRPLISVDLSTLGTYLYFEKFRRTPSPFTIDEEATSSGLPSLGKLCNEHPYEGPCPNLTHHPHNHYRHISQCQTHPSKPVHGRGDRDNRTHRSRIESYSPDQMEEINLASTKPSTTVTATRSSDTKPRLSLTTNPVSAATSKPRQSSTTKTDRSSSLKSKTISTVPSSTSKPRPSSTTRAKSLSMHPPPRQQQPPPPRSMRTTHPTLTSNPRPSSTSRAKPLSMNPPLRKQPPQPPPKPKRATHPAPSTAHRNARRKTYRLSEEEMRERYAKWYQGRGSEIGRGLWGLEIVSPSAGGEGRQGEMLWEMREKEGRSSHIEPPKSRLS